LPRHRARQDEQLLRPIRGRLHDDHQPQRNQEGHPMTDFTETRSMLKKLAMAHGADTAIGRACHNLLEMTENYSKEIGSDQRQQLRSNIEREKTRLNELVSQLS
jgi:hypothetical protein